MHKSDFHPPHTLSSSPPSSALLSPALPPIIGGSLAFYWQTWGEIGADQWVLRTVKEGYLMPFNTKPLFLNPIQFPAFGLCPKVFTKVLKPVLTYSHVHGLQLHMYLDDWLLNPNSYQKSTFQDFYVAIHFG